MQQSYTKSLLLILVPVLVIITGAIIAALNSRQTSVNTILPIVSKVTKNLENLPARSPVVSLYDRNGSIYALDSFKGRPFLVIFWATWCPPCVEEFPDLISLAIYLEKETDVNIIAISEDEKWTDIDKFTGKFSSIKKSANFQIYQDKEQKSASAFGTEKYPEAYFIDREHNVVRKFVGKQLWNHPEIRDWILRRSRK